MKFKKPQHLAEGDTVAIVSPSWSGPSVFPKVYERGLKILEEWGLKIKEFPTARAEGDNSFENAKRRAKDINDAFADSEVKAIIASIGGDDSVRILPFLNKELITNNPKILMGYSDTSTLLTYINQMGLVIFHGPSVMAGFAQMNTLPEEYKKHVHDILFTPSDLYEYPTYGSYCDGYLDWLDEENLEKIIPLKSDGGMRILQGSGVVKGQLFGGCIEVLEFLKGTPFWPQGDFWNSKILFLETSEEKPSITSVRWMLRNYGVQGVFEKINALMIARPRDYSDEEKNELAEMIKEIVSVEFGNTTLPVVINAEFGHTDPQIVLPLGVSLEIDLDNRKLKLTESCVEK